MTTATQLLNAEQVAALIEKSVATVNRYANSGRLPVALKLPGTRGDNLFAPADVRAFLKQRSNDAKAS